MWYNFSFCLCVRLFHDIQQNVDFVTDSFKFNLLLRLTEEARIQGGGIFFSFENQVIHFESTSTNLI